MFNEMNLLTMGEPRVKRDTLAIAEKFNIIIKHLFISESGDAGELIVFIEPTDEEKAISFENHLCEYMSGIIDMDGNRIGSDAVDCPCVDVCNIGDENKMKSMVHDYICMDDLKKLI